MKQVVNSSTNTYCCKHHHHRMMVMIAGSWHSGIGRIDLGTLGAVVVDVLKVVGDNRDAQAHHRPAE
jgi:hypothetical protein